MRTIPKELVQLEKIICKAANVTMDELLSQDRTKELVDARHAIWLIAFKNLGFSYKYLAQRYQKNRTTVMHGITKMLYTNAHQILETKLKEVCPELIMPLQRGEPKGLNAWEFQAGENGHNKVGKKLGIKSKKKISTT